MNDQKVRRIALGGVLSALILVMTILIHLPVPATGGYVHLGDGVIFLAAALLGPYAALSAAIGSALADLLGGYFIYIPATFLIKGAMGALAGLWARNGSLGRRLIVYALAETVMVLGYFAFEVILYGLAAAFAAIGPNLLQGAAGVTFGALLTSLVGRLPRKSKDGEN